MVRRNISFSDGEAAVTSFHLDAVICNTQADSEAKSFSEPIRGCSGIRINKDGDYRARRYRAVQAHSETLALEEYCRPLGSCQACWRLLRCTAKRIQLNAGLEAFLSEIEARFVVLPMSSRACVRAVSLPASYPRDPADRVIGATALVEGIPLVTADDAIRRRKTIPIIW